MAKELAGVESISEARQRSAMRKIVEKVNNREKSKIYQNRQEIKAGTGKSFREISNLRKRQAMSDENLKGLLGKHFKEERDWHQSALNGKRYKYANIPPSEWDFAYSIYGEELKEDSPAGWALMEKCFSAYRISEDKPKTFVKGNASLSNIKDLDNIIL